MFTVTPDFVTGYLKLAGNNDPDVLAARKSELIRQQSPMKYFAIVLIVLGTMMTLTIIGAIGGIPVLCTGGWLLSRVKSNVRLIEEASQDYINRLSAHVAA
ncbi:MAG TPA: DUF5362 family protein [Luteimonas sp.]|nr:DUF5362 family protein [Luteimonas sp.]HRO27504.1 DUF5362 family protein [Luteimonas sp.]HRP71881.1 DUF5362 family protein [Luteimonas sp.]